jgi:restriction system protein
MNEILLLVAAFAVALAIVYRIAARFRAPATHRWRRRQARTICAELRGRDRNQPRGLIYARLRAMDPLAFEELVVEAFEQSGHRVVRSARYSGDGGVDGEVIINGERILLQMKRYRSAIRPEHVRAFADVCSRRRARGLFIHAGRTGDQSRTAIADAPHIEIISGNRLIDLLTDGPDFRRRCDGRSARASA